MRYGASHHTGGHWTLALGSWCTEHGEYKHCRMVPPPLNTAHPAVAPHLLQTSCHHHAHQCSDTGDYQQTVTVTVTWTRSMFVTVCRPAVTSGIIVVVLPNLALEAGNQPGNSGAARGLAPGPVSAGLPRPGLEDVTRPARSSANVATLGREGVPRYCHHHIH